LPVDPIVAMYDEAILKVDDHLGRLFEDLRRRGLYDEAVVVVTGDHGESFEHDFYGHGCLWEDIVHVPLIVKLPGREAAGTRVAESVQLVDVYATLLDLVGHEPYAWLHGRSLLPLARGESRARAATFSEGGHVKQFMVEDGGWKLVELWPGQDTGDVSVLTHPRVDDAWLSTHFPALVGEALTPALFARLRSEDPGYADKLADLRARLQGPFYELYDLTNDRDERRDVAGEEPQIVARLRGLLEAEKARARQAQANVRHVVQPKSWSGEARRQLEALGYVDEEGALVSDFGPEDCP
jgi:arylsulfatase A-like enzyme